MYHLKRFYEPTVDMRLPTSMYKLEGFNKTNEQTENGQMPDDNATLSVIENIEKRQERVLLEIQKLQNQIEALLKDQKVTVTFETSKAVPSKTLSSSSLSSAPRQPTATTSTCKAVPSSLRTSTAVKGSIKNDVPVVEDLVISASPSRPPLSLIVLQQMLAKQFAVFSSSYVHSSARSSNTEHLRDVLCSSSCLPSNRNAYQYGFTIIWKEEKFSPVLKVNPGQQTPIIGECNIARYMARLLSPSYDSKDAVTSTQIDALIDLADGQLSNDAVQKGNFLKAFSGHLGKSQWVLGESLTVADIVLWSALHQSKLVSKAPDNIKRWIDSCNHHPDFAIVRQLI